MSGKLNLNPDRHRPSPESRAKILTRLKDVPRISKHADSAAATRDFLSKPSPRREALRDLMKELLSGDPVDRRCAADLARRISAREPGILGEYAAGREKSQCSQS